MGADAITARVGRPRRASEFGRYWASLMLLGALVSCVAIVPADARESTIVGGPYAVLEHGAKGGYEWRAFTSPQSASDLRSLPCINVTAERQLRPISEAEVFMSCGSVTPFPIVTQVALGSGTKKVTVAGMAFDREVHAVKIPLSDGRSVMRKPRLLSKPNARKAHVEQFAFLVFAVARGLSIGRVLGYDAEGHLVAGRPPR